MKSIPALFSALLLTGISQAVTIFNEGLDGDLSGAFGSPTSVTFSSPGANTVIGQIGVNGNTGATNGSDADYLTFILGPGVTLTSLTIDSFVSTENQSFMAFTSGSSFGGQTSGDIDGSVLFGASSGEVLDNLGGSLGPGTYSFWLQETTNTTVDYQITFNTVPEPSSSLLATFGLAGILFRRRR